MTFTCPNCYQRIDGRRDFCAEDGDDYITLNPHIDMKGSHCFPHPYNLITGKRKPIRGLAMKEKLLS